MEITKYESIDIKNKEYDNWRKGQEETNNNNFKYSEESSSSSRPSSHLRQTIAGENLNQMCKIFQLSAAGLFLALLSGSLFTANSFVINQYEVNVGDLLLVRSVLQLLI